MLWSALPWMTLLAFALSSYAAPTAASKNIISLKRTCSQPPSSRALVSQRVNTNATTLTAIEGGSGNTVPLYFGEELFDVIFDTGSSDLWLASNKLQCVDSRKVPQPQESCNFGPLFNSTFSDGAIADQNFLIRYLSGEILSGEMGYQDVTFSGITVENQQVALVNYGYWLGDQESSGLLGFAYPSITSAFSGTDPRDNDYEGSIHYNPFFWSAFERGKVESMFSLALTRGTEGAAGQLALGCLPDIQYKGEFVSTPLVVYNDPGSGVELTNLTYYTIVPEGYILHDSGAEKAYFASTGQPLDISSSLENASNISTSNQAIVDSGTTLTYLPTALSAKLNALFDPPAIYLADQDIYEVDCNATIPTFGVRISEREFYFDDRDLLLTGELGFDPETGLCMTGIQPAYTGPSILGDNFLKNVVAVFDVGNVEMRFAAQV